MPPRMRISILHATSCPLAPHVAISKRYVSAVATQTTATHLAGISEASASSTGSLPYPATQPPSHRRPEYRKSQLARQYTSLIRTSPLMVFFQNNNLKATEWSAIRRELARATAAVDEERAAAGRPEPPLAANIKIHNVQAGIFELAARIVDYFHPEQVKDGLTHDLSTNAIAKAYRKKGKHELTPLFLGPISVLTFPAVSPEHLKAALRVLSPKAPLFPAPKRRENPSWHEMDVQAGLTKLILLAARVDGKLFDEGQTRWVGSIEGGMSGLRAQVLMLLNSVGVQITSTLGGASKALYLTMESRRSMLEEKANGA
ncbi:hypothetical protein KEM54_002810 [Ascosphaera aggregata]|nr:hypothetical protein KEM54_002810 [Ascosphaera aggregata]